MSKPSDLLTFPMSDLITTSTDDYLSTYSISRLGESYVTGISI